MTRRTLTPTGLLMVAIAALGVVTTDRATAGEPNVADMNVISSDATARFVSLGLNKAVVIELPTDIRDVLVSNPKIVNAVVRSRRRVYIIGLDVGQSNIYIFDADSRQIGALTIGVSNDQQLTPPLLAKSGIASNVISVYRGDDLVTVDCTRRACTNPRKLAAPPTLNSVGKTTLQDAKGNVTGTSTTTSTSTGP
jgi:Flp pilus assembly secretin CpaC